MSAVLRRMPKQKRAMEKYHAILDAAIVVLAREGYDGTNTSNIAKESGVAVGSLYEYFPNKESIFRAFLEERINHLLTSLKHNIDSGYKTDQKKLRNRLPRENLRHWLRLILRLSHKNKEVLRVIVNEVPGAVNLLSFEDIEDQVMPLAKFLAEGMQLSEGQLKVKTFILSNALYGFLLRSLFSGDEFQVDDVADELLKLVSAYAELD